MCKGRNLAMGLRGWKMFLLFATTVVAVAYAGSVQDKFEEVGECESNRVCVYNYKAVQDEFEDEVSQTATVTSTVEISCDAVGQYENKPATRYSLAISNVALLTQPLDESASPESIPAKTADRMVAGWFSFVQTEDGKVVAVNHGSDEPQDVVNFKKSIAASFQANFKQTEQEEEVDPQSAHVSHYSYETKEDVSVIHRSFTQEDLLELASHIPKDKVKITKDEQLTYKSGTLQQSTGTIYMKLFPEATNRIQRRETVEQTETYDGTFHANKFSVKGSYVMDLDHCYSIPREAGKRRRNTRDSMLKGYTESTLKVHINLTSAHLLKMKELRQAIPSVPTALHALHHIPTEPSLVNHLQKLLVLESQYGPLPGFTPALNDVLDYLQKISESGDPSDVKMRLIIYSLLSAEGSPLSQKVLIHSLELMTDEKERKTVITFIAFIENPTPELVSQFESLIDPDLESTDPQLLAYGALASSATPALQQRIVQFLQSRLVAAENNLVAVVHLIHALSNTGCNTTVSIFIGYLNHENVNVQLAAINAMRKHTNNELVRDAFISMLNQPSLTEVQITAIVKTLISGLEHQNLKGLKKADNTLLLTTLVSAAMKVDSLELHQLLLCYALKSDTDESNEHLNILYTSVAEAEMKPEGNETHGRLKRGTSYWKSSNSLYNLVESYSDRVNDYNNYPYHKAYLWAKEFGVSDLNAKIAAGGFIGVSSNGFDFKVFARAKAQGEAFGYTITALDVKLLIEKSGTDWEVQLYAEVKGHVLVSYDETKSLEWTYEWPLYESTTYTILHLEHSVWIHVGWLTFNIDIYAELGVTAEAVLSADFLSSATAAVIPVATLTAEASAQASLLGLIRGGIKVKAEFSYQLQPEVSTEVCIPQFAIQTCLGVYDEYPKSYVEIYAYYQVQSTVWCKGYWGVSYPCGYDWGGENKWKALSARWDLWARGKTAIWSVCDNEISDCYLIAP